MWMEKKGEMTSFFSKHQGAPKTIMTQKSAMFKIVRKVSRRGINLSPCISLKVGKIQHDFRFRSFSAESKAGKFGLAQDNQLIFQTWSHYFWQSYGKICERTELWEFLAGKSIRKNNNFTSQLWQTQLI